MKKNRTTRLIVLVLFLAIVTAVIISGTFAKYTTSASGQGSAVVAKWDVDLKAGDATFTDSTTFTLADTDVNGKVADGKIAPGTDGSFSLKIDPKDSEVAIHYVVKISELSNEPTNIKFYKLAADGNTKEYFDLSGDSFTIDGDIALGGSEVTLPIYWEWPYEIGEGDVLATNDANDTIDGEKDEAGRKMKFKVELTAEQADPRVAASATPATTPGP